VRRTTLQRALRQETARRAIPIEYGKRLVSISTFSDAVVAHFADGASAQGDLLIGADGIHSRTRTLIDPTAPQPHFTGLVGLGGFSRLPSVGVSDP
jgi:FAD-dependent urate hydroxylase